MIDSSLVPGNSAVLGHLYVAVRVPPDKDWSIVWHELYCLRDPWASDELDHYLC